MGSESCVHGENLFTYNSRHTFKWFIQIQFKPSEQSQQIKMFLNEIMGLRKSQVVSSRDARDPHQLPEVGSSVTVTSPTRSHPDPVSSHILDTSVGSPARGVMVTMFRMGGTDQVWTKLQARVTNDDGRASNFLSWEDFRPGTYKIILQLDNTSRRNKLRLFILMLRLCLRSKIPSLTTTSHCFSILSDTLPTEDHKR